MTRFVDLDDGRRAVLTEHAARRLVEMRLGSPHVRAILTGPDYITESSRFPGDQVYRLGDHALAIREERGDLVVKTALYACKAAWRRAQQMGRLPADRSLRPDMHLPEN